MNGGVVHLIQYVSESTSKDRAEAQLRALAAQTDFVGGRVLPPGPGKPTWRAQSFHDPAGTPLTGWAPLTHPPTWRLPAGARHVLVPKSQFKALGIK